MQRHWRLQRQAEWRSEETKALASPLPGAEYSGTSPYKKKLETLKKERKILKCGTGGNAIVLLHRKTPGYLWPCI